MEDSKELKELKSTLRSLVVSSPTQMDLRSLLRDFRNMMGQALPISKFGYRDPLQFLKEHCSDCFLFQGQSSNPQLILIVTDNIRHIDEFVRKQKISSVHKIKGKRRSVPGSSVNTPNLIAQTFVPQSKYATSSVEVRKPFEKKPSEVQHTPKRPENNIKLHDELESKQAVERTKSPEEGTNSLAYQNFVKRRLPIFDSALCLEEDKSYKEDESQRYTSDYAAGSSSQSHPSSSGSSSKQMQLEELKAEVKELIADSPEGVWCGDLMKLYRKRHGRELEFARFGFTTIVGLAAQLDADVDMLRAGDAGALLLRLRRLAPAAPPRPSRRRGPPPPPAAGLDDALPGIDFDPDVFPADCVQYSDSIPFASLEGLEPGAMVEVMVGEVYSPSHFWLLRLGDDYHIAMEELMDKMTEYYSAGEGRERALAVGAVREGHYCSSLYERDWHRSIVVKVVDSDTVKVRHVDYGTVETAAAGALKPLRREWARLPAQALRARLAGVRPGAAGRRWPHAACVHFLRLVQDRPLVANVVAVDHEERILEVCLVDTATARDVRLDRELVRAGHADSRPDSALAASESYLYPRFDALEGGATPNFADIHAYLRDGIELDFVEDFRRHVPCRLSPLAPPAPAPAPTASPPRAPPTPASPPATPPVSRVKLINRVPLLPRPPSPEPEPEPSSSEGSRASSPHTEPEVPPEPAAFPPDSPWAAISPVDPFPAFVKPQRPSPPLLPPVVRSMLPVPPQSANIMRAMPVYNVFSPPQLFHPMPPFAPVPHVYPPPLLPMPPIAPMPPLPPLQFPYPPRASHSPPPPYNGASPAPAPRRYSTSGGVVVLSVSECEIYSLLNRVDRNAAHWYMVDAINRGRRAAQPAEAPGPASTLNPDAAEFRSASVTTQTETGPPPGFELP